MSLRLKLLVPVIVASLALAVYLSDSAALILAWGALLAIATWAAIEYWVNRPLGRINQFAQALARDETGISLEKGHDEIGAVSASLERVRDVLGKKRQQLAREIDERGRIEVAARETEERYALAVSGANDGLWEWNLKSGVAYFSPRWKSMLGYDGAEIGGMLDEWRLRIHPDDRARALAELDAHLEGRSPRYECEQRLRHRDGRYRWVLVRGAAILNAGGKPYRLVGLNTDINARKRVEQILSGLSDGLDNAHGEAFFHVLVKNFATVLGVQRAFITECVDESKQSLRQLARWDSGDFTATRVYQVEGTPCKEVIETGRTCVYANRLAELFEEAKNFESYVGMPIFDGEHNVLGHIVCVDSQPLREELPLDAIFTLYAVRAGLELERRDLMRRLRLTAPSA